MPATANVHIDTLLSGIASGHRNAQYMAAEAVPVIPVPKESGKIGVYGTDHYRLDFPPRGITGSTPGGDWTALTPLNYSADEWSFKFYVDDRQRALYDDPFDAERDATLFATDKILLKREDIVGSLLTTSGNFGGTTAGGAWSGAGTPKTNIRDAIKALVARTGAAVNNIYGVCSFDVWQNLLSNSQVTNLFVNTNPNAAGVNSLSTKAVANSLGLQDIYVFNSVKLTTDEGVADTFAYVMGTTTFAVIVKAARPSILDPGWGALISPTQTIGGLKGLSVVVDKWRDEDKRSDVIRAATMFDALAITARLGQLITGLS